MKRIILAIFLCIGVMVAGTVPAMASFTGSLTVGGGGITATGGWNSTSTVFSWTITQVGSLWQYDYTMTVPEKNISHFIVEVSPEAVAADFSAGIFDIYSSTSQGNSNPGMPEEMSGLKFQPGTLTLTASFTTARSPVWGDFYAKSGRDNGVWVTAWNAGFTVLDPTDLPSNGSIGNHILRPDTATTVPPVPIPGAVWLLGSGLLGLLGLRRKFIG